MNGGLETTLSKLSKTTNEAAVPLLIRALDSAHQAIQLGALKALLTRRSVAGHDELLARWHTFSERWKDLLAERSGRMAPSLRSAVLGSDTRLCENGCAAVVWFRDYDMAPALINAAEDETNPNADLVAHTLLLLAERLYEELAGPRDYRRRRDPQLVRQHLVGSLELSMQHYQKHKRSEIVEAFLLLAGRDNAALKRILHDPFDKAHRCVVETLTYSERSGAIALLLNFLDDPQAPSAALTVMAHRGDRGFLEHLLRKIGYEPSASARHNLRRIERLYWLDDDPAMLNELSGEQQHSLVQLLMASGLRRLDVFRVIQYLMTRGENAGRRAATAALAEFKGADANQLLLNALDDEDCYVQAGALCQLRDRGIPGALTKLIEKIDSPHEVVRAAARECLSEFSFERYLSAFDMLDDAVRESTGQLVVKVDPQVPRKLLNEMEAPSRSRRLRAIAVAASLDVVGALERPLIGLLKGDDHIVRAEAAKALAACPTSAVRAALREALLDRSVTVQDAAETSLQQLVKRSGSESEGKRADGRPATIGGPKKEPT